MNRLFINTANSNLFIMLKTENQYVVRNEASVKKHNERILGLIEEVLTEAKLSLQQIDKFGVVVGPGSFTGIRVGIATVKAFRDATSKKAVGINNLELLYAHALKCGIDTVAIEGSLNSYFVASCINGQMYIYNRNLTEQELIDIAKEKPVGCFEITDKMKVSNIKFKELPLNNEIIDDLFVNSQDESLIPVYYQLSQAENEKINRANCIISMLTEEDTDRISELETDLFKDKKVGDSAWNEKVILDIILNPNYLNFGLKIDNNIVGYIICEETDEINISRVAVDNNFQNHGLASKLIAYVENLAKEKRKVVSLEVCENNIRALNLYKKLGFVERRVRKNYYKDHSSCIEMYK